MENMQHLNKAERKILKRERKKEEKVKKREEWRKKDRNKKLKFWVKVLFAIVVIVMAGSFWRANGAKIDITPSEYDFGQVSVRRGTVNTTLTLRNTGKRDLIIKGLSTSCMCTSATIVVDGVEGPVFGMKGHGTNPTGWSATIPQGGQAQLRIYYNPTVHKDFRGPVTRTITILTNTPLGGGKMVTIRANQVS